MAGLVAKGGTHDTPAGPTDGAADDVRDQYERQLAERLALLLAAEFRRRLEERQLKERRDG